MNKNFLEILSINGKASIQDLGRLSAQHLGFSVSGAADEYAFRYANKLITDYQKTITGSMVQHQKNCAVLEVTLGQISLRANVDCIIAITGADCQVQLSNASMNKTPIANWQCYQLTRGDIIDFSMPKNGLHSYIAVQGGFSCQENKQAFLASFAQTENEMLLGLMGEKLTVGSQLFFADELLAAESNNTERSLTSAESLKTNSTPKNTNKPELFYANQELTLRFIANKLFLQLSAEKQQQFLSTRYTVSPDSNRMGYRLLPKNYTTEILPECLRAASNLSKPVTFGTIQLPANNQPIVLMKERQTMGGYPVLGTVIQTDLFRLSQMRPGQEIKFSEISYQQAQQQLKAFYQKF